MSKVESYCVAIASLSPALAEQGGRYAQSGRCAPSHSLEPGRNMRVKGPSLAELWGRKARLLPGFDCY